MQDIQELLYKQRVRQTKGEDKMDQLKAELCLQYQNISGEKLLEIPNDSKFVGQGPLAQVALGVQEDSLLHPDNINFMRHL